jgi:anthranilate/para-aminobenzoate synthase component II
MLTRIDKERAEGGVDFDFFDTRLGGELPDINYDIFISSGGPGSPYDGQGQSWEKNYFNLLDRIYAHNQNGNPQKKYVFFICHSFQMMVRFFGLADVVRRHSESFGIFPVHKTEAGKADPLLQGLADPFFGSDFRNWQVIQPNRPQLKSLGAKILCIEKIRPHVPYERAIMAIRVSPEMVGTQFHPESDPASIRWHLHHPKKKAHIIDRWGLTKFQQMQQLADSVDAILRTRKTIIPGFIDCAIRALRPPF